MPYLLTHTDEQGDRLPIMDKMQRYQKQFRESEFEKRTGEKLNGRHIWGELYFCLYPLGMFVFDKLIKSPKGLSANQYEMLEDYVQWKGGKTRLDFRLGDDFPFILDLIRQFPEEE